MPTEIVVPALGESVLEATVDRWLKNEGDSVAMGEPVVELETEKVSTQVSAEEAGVVVRIQHKEGDTVHPGEVLGVIETGVQAAHPAAAEPPAAAPVPPSAPSPPPAVPAAAYRPESRSELRQRLSRRRLTIARRLVEAQQTAAMLTTFNEVDMSSVIDLRHRQRDVFREATGVDLGFMSFFFKAAVAALKSFPQVNAELQSDELVLKQYYDVGIALDDPQGLVVPVVRDADKLTFAQIEAAINGFVQKARERTLTLEDLRGGTFTITNGGVFGSLLSTPILNPPQVGILGMHRIAERPVVVNGEVVIRPMMYVALSYDHRVVDGREAVLFLVRIKELIEDPERLLLEG